ncbi:Uma2 family endonuclease [Romeria aff. gracilis LEGE 07310]|uniref:Uma2 family endonuclease n=1 Tax=Vasconcelosia minhoensis LEGE 07310 TaxID=915328 RepID=A0A8J7AWE7_9CYAN|nr:Uma2 family endonuclease [Romeria gracilis]MBE9078408.1 Uma2 family endonuclease [Romeria aff. gracilis LEGE 07310]
MILSTLDLNPVIDLTDEQFYQLCQANPEVKFERNANGTLVIMSPTGGETGNRNFEIGADFAIWNRQTQLGICFDSSTGFRLPNGAQRSPDIAWIKQSRWQALTPAQRERFPPIAPDFVLELLSPSDTLPASQTKMQEYINNGVQLGWLIERKTRTVQIYRPGKPVETLNNPSQLSGEAILPGFTLDMSLVW